MGKPSEPGLWQDSFSEMSAGMNSDVPPIALPKNQAAFLENFTCRGNYLTSRSSYRDCSLTFSGENTQGNFEEKIFQGACYYKPDVGQENIVISIGGKLFKATPDTIGNGVVISDISISGNLNDENLQLSWLWQGENYIFCNNGQDPTLIFDGNKTLRSDPGTVVGTTSGSAAIPAIGNSVAVSLAGPYVGAYGISVQVLPSASSTNVIGQFQVNPVAGLYRATLLNVTGTPGALVPSGTTVTTNPSLIGKLTASVSVSSGSAVPGGVQQQPLTIDTVYNYNTNYALGPAESWSMVDSTGALRTFTAYQTFGGYVIVPFHLIWALSGAWPAMFFAAGTVVNKVGAGVVTNTAEISAEFTIPAIGATVEVSLDAPYMGADGATVYIGNEKFTITALAPPTSASVNLTAISLSQTTGTIPSGAVLKTIPQIPVGRMGVYGLGRNWICLADGTSYIASDIVGGSSGTLVNRFRDSILNFTENKYLAGGGVFRVPSSGQSICAMRFPATLDSSLGQGPLQVLTQTTTFSCNAPVQRALWQDLTNPIQTQSLVGGGALAQNSTVAVNGDLFFRSTDGIRSLKLARQDFQTAYGNTPQSVEMNRILLDDDRTLLGYSSAIVFDNRLLMTAAPAQSVRGVYHSQLVALNLDPNSSLRVKAPPIYDGAWSGRNFMQLVVGSFNGIERAFAITYDTDTQKLGMTEILPTSSTNLFDNGDVRIRSSMESPALFYQQDASKRELLRLNDGELIVSDVVGAVRFDVYYRPDYDKNWHSWRSFEIPASPDYQPRIGLGQPNLKESDAATGRPYAVGYHFQVRIVITGSCIVTGANFYAVGQPVPQFANPLPSLTPLEI
jgi:hypothetical protein